MSFVLPLCRWSIKRCATRNKNYYTARPKHEAFESPAKSDRMGCFDDYCVAMIPIEAKEFCYSD